MLPNNELIAIFVRAKRHKSAFFLAIGQLPITSRIVTLIGVAIIAWGVKDQTVVSHVLRSIRW